MKNAKTWRGWPMGRMWMAGVLLVGVLAGRPVWGESVYATSGNWSYWYNLDTMKATVVGYSGSSISPDIPTSFSLQYDTGEKDEDGEIIWGTHHFKVTALSGTFAGNTTITSISVPLGVTNVGASTFSGCTSLRSATLSSSVEALGGGAFYGCTSLGSVTLPFVTTFGASAFKGCTSLGSVDLPRSATTLGDSMFEECSSLRSVNIPPLVKTIPDKCFSRCSSLEFINEPSRVIDVTHIGNWAFFDCSVLPDVTFGDSLKSIGNDAFWGCDHLQHVSLGASVTYLGTNTFSCCDRLEDVSLDCPLTLSVGLFSNCVALTTVKIGNKVKGLGSSSTGAHPFQNCPKIEFFRVGNGITEIPAYYFSTNRPRSSVYDKAIFPAGTNITRIDLSQSLEAIGDYAFCGCRNAEFTFWLAPNLKTVGNYAFDDCRQMDAFDFLSLSLETIGTNAFRNCSQLQDVTTGSNVAFAPQLNSIRVGAFDGCQRLGSITCGAGLRELGSNAFSRCTGLTNITLESSITNLGREAFFDCSRLERGRVDCPAELSRGLFSYCTDLATVELGDHVKGLGPNTSSNHPFYRCPNIKTFHVGSGVTEIPDYYFSTNQASRWDGFLSRGTIEQIDLPESLERIGTCAFRNCSNASFTVTAFPHLTTVESNAFYNCRRLETFDFPDSLSFIGEGAFANCTNLKGSVTLGVNITNLSPHAFSGCRSIESVAVDNVRAIGASAFAGCTNVAAVHIKDLAAWCGVEFSNWKANPLQNRLFLNGTEITDLVIPDGVAEIGAYAFERCRGLKTAVIPDEVKNIGDSAFSSCSGLTNLTIGTGVTNLPASAFGGCSALASLTLRASPENVYGKNAPPFEDCPLRSLRVEARIIPGYMFYESTNLESLVFSDRVESIREYAFTGCSNLTSVVIPVGVTDLGRDAFADCPRLTEATVLGTITNAYRGRWISYPERIAGTPFANSPLERATVGGRATCVPEELFCTQTNLTEVTLGANVTDILSNAFSDCYALVSVAFPDGLKNIGERAFANCTFLQTGRIPDSVTNIGARAFWYCGSLRSAVLGDSVETIGAQAFEWCRSLASVRIPDSVKRIEADAFGECNRLEEVQIHDVGAWCGIAFEMGGSSFAPRCSNPTYYSHRLCVDGDEIARLVIPEGVTDVGNYAFVSCTGLTEVVVSATVTNIGTSAFSGCSGLEWAYLPASLKGKVEQAGWPETCRIVYGELQTEETEDGTAWTYAVAGGSATIWGGTLKGDAVIPVTLGGVPVEAIGALAFSGCEGLTSVTIGGNVKTIGASAFAGCTKLAALHIQDLTAWCGMAFGHQFANPLLYAGHLFLNGEEITNLVVPAGVAEIGAYAFCGCRGLTNVVIPDGVTNIGRGAFFACSNLRTATMAGSVRSIGWGAFSGSGLEEMSIPDGVTSIEGTAFSSCTNLTSVTIPNSVTSIGYSAFSSCTNLTGVTIPDSVTSIGDSVFEDCSGLTNVTIGNGVTSIGDSMFSSCTNLTSVTIPGNVTNIGDYAFRNCSGLTNVTIPGGVTSIGNSAFYFCTNLTSVTISNGVASIGDYAFRNCSGLTSLTLPGSLMGEWGVGIGWSAFAGTGLKAVYVPAEWEGSEIDSAFWGLPEGCAVVYGKAPEEEATTTTPVAVPHGWLDSDGKDILEANGGDYEAAAKAEAANGMAVWECYVAGLSTTNAGAAFKVKSIEFVDGKPVVKWEPDLNGGGTGTERAYRVWARKSVEKAEEEGEGVEDGWKDVTGEESTWVADGWRFFRVDVELPK